jgi:hypothetical protein
MREESLVRHLLELADGALQVPRWTSDFKQPYLIDRGAWEASPAMPHWEVCYLNTGIDHLILHDRLISKNALHRVVGPLWSASIATSPPW